MSNKPKQKLKKRMLCIRICPCGGKQNGDYDLIKSRGVFYCTHCARAAPFVEPDEHHVFET